MAAHTFLEQRVLQRLRAEYLEMPGMKLRIEEVERLCGIEPPTCKLALDALVKAQFLSVTSEGSYVRLTEGPVRLQRPVKATPFVPNSRRAS